LALRKKAQYVVVLATMLYVIFFMERLEFWIANDGVEDMDMCTKVK
jgi:hypothetical protein